MAANFALASGTCNAAVNQLVNWDTVSVGVFAGAITPNQMSASRANSARVESEGFPSASQ